jgi:signal transduction histidine kinase/CheY-like chemotaxis protein
MFLTENSGPLWVGRRVDPSPLAAFRNALTLRVLLIILVLVVIVLMLAHWIAVRLEGFGQELTRGIGRMLKEDEEVAFAWKGPQEVRSLAQDLNVLAHTHAEHAHALREHAKELEESNRYKSEFLANVSHELRTPLNSILLLSKMLAEPATGLQGEQAKQAGVIHQAGKDLLGLIENILDHSRIEAQETHLHLVWFEPRVLIEELMQLVKPQFAQKGLYLELEVASDAPTHIRSDRDKLSQILKNFLSNAVKFTDTGGVLISLDRVGHEECPLAIQVADTGIGIPEAKQQLVFEAFKQADGSTSRRYGGTGLGLSISRELAHLLGGMIELQSSEGGGSTFSLFLPLDPEDPKAKPPPRSDDVRVMPAADSFQQRTVPQADFSGHYILVVERDVSILLYLTPLLESWGMRVTAAADREETLDSLEEDERYSLVLLDAEMPEMDGCATIELIRRDPRCASAPIIAMVDADDEKLADRCKETGADDLLVRPVDSHNLKDLLEKHLVGKEKRNQAYTAS